MITTATVVSFLIGVVVGSLIGAFITALLSLKGDDNEHK